MEIDLNVVGNLFFGEKFAIFGGNRGRGIGGILGHGVVELVDRGFGCRVCGQY